MTAVSNSTQRPLKDSITWQSIYIKPQGNIGEINKINDVLGCDWACLVDA